MEPNVISNPHDHLRITNVVSLAPGKPQSSGVYIQMKPVQIAGAGGVQENPAQEVVVIQAPASKEQL